MFRPICLNNVIKTDIYTKKHFYPSPQIAGGSQFEARNNAFADLMRERFDETAARTTKNFSGNSAWKQLTQGGYL